MEEIEYYQSMFFVYILIFSQPKRHYLSWQWPSSEHWDWHQRCTRGQICACARRSCGDGSRSGPCWAAAARGRWSARPASWGSPACRCLRWCAPHNPGGENVHVCFSYYLHLLWWETTSLKNSQEASEAFRMKNLAWQFLFWDPCLSFHWRNQDIRRFSSPKQLCRFSRNPSWIQGHQKGRVCLRATT